MATPKPFPFLELPAEIRNRIYRLVLLMQNVTTVVPRANHADGIPGEQGVDHVVSVRPGPSVGRGLHSVWRGGFIEPCGRVPVGTIRCESWSTWTFAYQISLFRANRQIYLEASGIFHMENFWIIFQVNRLGFGQQLKNRGFPVVAATTTAGDLGWRNHIRFPVMKVRVRFSQQKQGQGDAFLVPAALVKKVVRALWTAEGSSEMEVMLHIQPRRTNSPEELDLLRPFEKLRSIKRAIIFGASDQKNADDLRGLLTATGDIKYAFRELLAGTRRLQRCLEEQFWEDAIVQAKEQAILVADCKTVYDKRFFGVEPGISLYRGVVRRQAAKEMIIATAVAIAEITLVLHQYENSVRFADRALDLIFRASMTQLSTSTGATITGTITFDGQTTALVVGIRTRAITGLRQLERVSLDVVPQDSMPASMPEVLQVGSAQVPVALPPSPDLQSSALAVNFARAVDVMVFDG